MAAVQLVGHVGPHLRRFAGGARAQRLQFLLFDLFEDVAVLFHQKLAPQQRADAGLGDRDIRRLGNVVVRARLEAGRHVLLIFVRGQHNQHDLRLGGAMPAANQAAHFGPIEARHFEIHQHAIE